MMMSRLLSGTAILLLLSGPALAQSSGTVESAPQPMQMAPADSSPQERTESDPASQEPATQLHTTGDAESKAANFIPSQAEDQRIAQQIVGLKVTNPEKEDLGKISDLVLNNENRVVAYILSTGGFLGIGGKRVAVEQDQLALNPDEEVAVINVTKDELTQAPAFKTQAELRAEQDAERRKLEQQSRQPAGGLGGGTAR